MADSNASSGGDGRTSFDDLIGRSICSEELKGDYRAARAWAQSALGAARRHADAPATADALIAGALVDVLAGNTGAALRGCAQARELAAGDPVRSLRAAACAHLAVFGHFNTLPDRGGANGAEIDARWQGMAYLEGELPAWQSLFMAVGDPAVRAETWLLHQFLPGLQAPRASATMSRFMPLVPGLREMQASVVQDLLAAQQSAPAFGYAVLAAADLCRRGGDESQSQTLLHAALAAYAQAGDAAGQAACHLHWGDALAAPCSSPPAMNLLLIEGGSEGSDLSWTWEAREGLRAGLDVAGAQRHYDEAQRLFTLAGAPRGLAALALRRAWLAALDGVFGAALEQAQAAQDAFEHCGDDAGVMLARVHTALYRVAIPQRVEDREACAAAGSWGAGDGSFSQTLGLGLLCNRVARDWLTRRADVERAIACYRLAEALFGALGAHANRAQSLIDQGRCALAAGDHRTALTLYEEALELMATDRRERPTLAPTLRRRSVMLAISTFQLYQAQRDVEGIERSARRVRDVVADLPAADAGAWAAADGEAVEAFALGELGRSIVAQAAVLAPLYRAVAARDAGDEGAAETLFEQALTAARAADEGERDFLEATVWAQRRQVQPAIEAFRRYLARGGADAGFVGGLTALMVAQGGATGEAEARRQRERTHEQGFAFMVALQAWGAAREELHALEALAGPDWWRACDKPWQELRQRAETEEGLGELDAALASYAQAIAILEQRRADLTSDEHKLAFSGERGAQDLYFMAGRAALRHGDLALAFRYVESGRARALLDLVAGVRPGDAASAVSDDAVGQWRQLNARLALHRRLLAQARGALTPEPERVAMLSERIGADEAQLHMLETTLATTQPKFVEAIGREARVLTLDEACAALPPGTALLEFSFLGDELLAWVLTAQGMADSRCVSLNVPMFARQVRDFHRACASRGDTRSLGASIAATLLEPFAETLRAHMRLVVVPYAATHLLPLAALPFDGQPLGVTHALSTLPSASMLQFVKLDAPLRASATGAVDALHVLAVGNPAGDLRGAEFEATYVARLYGDAPLLGEAATLAAVLERLPGCRVLHFATHGRLVEDAPLASSLMLAGGDELTVHQLMGLRLDADLVVLSACETGRGEATGGDDVVGLTRSLLAAGARAVVVSLWPVDDVATSLFMGEFHRNLLGGMVPALALHRALVVLRGAGAHERRRLADELVLDPCGTALLDGATERHLGPGSAVVSADLQHLYYWASFVLVG